MSHTVDTVDVWKAVVNEGGLGYQPQLVSLPDFWSIKSMRHVLTKKCCWRKPRQKQKRMKIKRTMKKSCRTCLKNTREDIHCVARWHDVTMAGWTHLRSPARSGNAIRGASLRKQHKRLGLLVVSEFDMFRVQISTLKVRNSICPNLTPNLTWLVSMVTLRLMSHQTCRSWREERAPFRRSHCENQPLMSWIFILFMWCHVTLKNILPLQNFGNPPEFQGVFAWAKVWLLWQELAATKDYAETQRFGLCKHPKFTTKASTRAGFCGLLWHFDSRFGAHHWRDFTNMTSWYGKVFWWQAYFSDSRQWD